MSFFSDYNKALKDPQVEELVDLYLFRPPAYVCAKLFFPFPITPNHITFMGLILGWSSAYFFFQGFYVWGGIFFGLYAVLDNCDGMIARMKKNGSDIGKIIDGVVDYLVNIAVFIAIGISLVKDGFSSSGYVWALVVGTGICNGIHSGLFDNYLSMYLDTKDGVLPEKKIEEVEISDSFFRIISLYVFKLYSKLQGSGRNNHLYLDEGFRSRNIKLLKMWGLIGPSTHILFLLLSAILNRFDILFFYTLIFANIWMVLMFAVQSFFNKQFENKLNTKEV